MSIWSTHVVIYQALNTLICRHVNVDVYSQACPPSLIYCICAPSHVDFGYAFSPATYLGHLLLHVGTSRTPRISYFPYSFAGRRHIWVAFYLMSKAAPPPWSTQIFSLMHQRWQIDPKYAELKSEIYHQGFNFSKIFFLLQRSGRCGATCSKSTATWRSRSFFQRAVDRQSFILRKFMYL